ncbi:MAG: efflux RND transporter periplasmic adaptor subunit [Thermoanaerobaculia bacterium]|nr:efflux RND transporter periplasmic adaptor subunit [Thermoanaerobaculia bacterium]
MMEECEDTHEEPRNSDRTVWTIVLCMAILTLAGGIVYVIRSTEPTAERGDVMRRSAALVEVVEVFRADHRPEVVVLGTVEASRDLELSPRVSGEIVAMAPSFEPGGLVERGATLVTIDPADYRNALAMRRSELREARATLLIEQGRRTVAEREFALLDETIDDDNRALVLREPQIESAEARVDAALAAVTQAELHLRRTEVTAPFDAQVLARDVDLGSQVGPGDRLARLVGIEQAWVIAAVPMRTLPWLRFESDGDGSSVRVRDRTAWEPGVFREGVLTRLIGTVDDQTRLARVLVTVEDPLAHRSDAPPFLLGTVVEVRVEGRVLEDVVRVDRELVREDDTVWVFAEGKLEIRPVRVTFRDAEHAYIGDGLDNGERIVVTNLATVSDGIDLRLNENLGADGGGAG